MFEALIQDGHMTENTTEVLQPLHTLYVGDRFRFENSTTVFAVTKGSHRGFVDIVNTQTNEGHKTGSHRNVYLLKPVPEPDQTVHAETPVQMLTRYAEEHGAKATEALAAGDHTLSTLELVIANAFQMAAKAEASA